MSPVLSKGSMIMGGASAGVGLATAVLIVSTANGEGYAGFLLAAPLAAFATSVFFWWWLLDRQGRYTSGRGAWAGALAGAIAHYPCWLLLMFGSYACFSLTGGCTGSLGDGPMSPLDALWAAAMFSLFSLLFYGWLTIPAGAVIGALVARWRVTQGGTA
jgi:hypothetical protein